MSSMIGRTGSGMGMATGNKIPKGYEQGSLQQFTPEQMQLFRSLFAHLSPGGQLSKLAGGDEATFNQMEAPAMRQFAGLQGNLASRFSGMGSFGARNSSGFQNTANQASSDFAQDLQSRRTDLQRQALKDLMGMSNELLGQRPQENFLVKKPPSFLQQLLGGLGNIGGQIGGGVGTAALLKALGLGG
jgi:hypothetical protein